MYQTTKFNNASTEWILNAEQSNDGQIPNNTHQYVPFVVTTNTIPNDEVQQATAHQLKTQGKLYRDLNESVIEQSDDEDMPLLN